MDKKLKPEADKFAEISWNWTDVKTLRPRWSRKKCEEFLGANEKWITDSTIQHGWEVMEGLL